MKAKYLVFAFVAAVFISIIFCASTASFANAEVTPENLQVIIYNKGQELSETAYELQEVGGVDQYELEYFEGISLSFDSRFVGVSVTVESTEVSIGSVPQTEDYKITKAGTYNLLITANYIKGGSVAQVTREIRVVISKIAIEIEFEKTEKYYKDGSGGATAKYVNQPQGVLNTSLKLNYYADEHLETLIDLPENAGTYYVKAYYQDESHPNYVASKVMPFVIKKSIAEITAINQTTTFVNENFDIKELMQTQIIGEIANTNFVYEVLEGSSWVTKEIIDSGEYTVRFKFEGSEDNYENYVSEEYSFLVSEAHIYFSLVGDIRFAYSGSVPDIVGLFNDQILMYNAYSATQITQNYGELSVLYYNLNEQPIDPPNAIGKYKFVIKAGATANYITNDSEMFDFEITKIPISFGYQGNYDPVRHRITETYSGNDVEVQYLMLDDFSVSIQEQIINQQITYSKLPEDTQINGLPTMPGLYIVKISVETEHFLGETNVELYIEYLELPVGIDIYFEDELLTNFDNIKIDYLAKSIAFVPFVEEGYDIDDFVIEYVGVGSTQYPLSSNAPQHAGSYKVTISLNDDVYQKSVQFEFEILKKEITVRAKDLTITYGDRVYMVTTSQAYQASDLIVEGLAAGDTADSIVRNIRILIGNNKLTQTDSSIVVGNYELSIAVYENNSSNRDILEHPSYTIISSSNKGTLTVTKRDLYVKMGDSAVIAGNNIIPSIKEITGYAPLYSNDSDITIKPLIGWYYMQGESRFDNIPNTAGTYSIVASGALNNYNVISLDGVLTVSSGNIKDSNGLGFELNGKFSEEERLTVFFGSITNDIKSEVKKILPKHDALYVYEIKAKAVTVDNSRFTVNIDLSEIKNSSGVKVIAKYGNVYTELDFSQNGDIITINEQILADAYILCGVAKFNWLWVIMIGAIVLIVATIVGVILRIYLTGGFKKKFEESAKTVTVQTSRAKTEADELDELIETFDESTVVREMTPAERLEQKQKEEKYEQYRLKLQRLRSLGDKALEDSLRQSGIANIDDEIIIEKMIKDDEERMRKIEEEIRLEKEAEEKEKEKPIAVILPKSTESYEQKSFAPKAKLDDDDFDI